ncbi:hypothetical protein CYMTET_51368 [Cymbomonas tetramitiformis]|uniref:Uncharacterized protein n=1 Tax=Cymbomonas tetramitiformis TaxID=36881 RepID=A0AAE0BLE7_9CHLO|nr:hypothetical protein CYMTET_51368 [Cymbomonas tetramitiformis]
METRIKAKRKVLKESDLDSSLRLADAVRNSPTVRTPPVPIPPAPAQDELPAVARAPQKFEDVKSIVNFIYSKGWHRKWAKVIKQHALGGEYFDASDDVSNWTRLSWPSRRRSSRPVWIPTFSTWTTPPLLVVHRSVNELVYDTLGYIVEPDSVVYGYLLGTDAVSDRGSRRALVDLIKGRVPPAVRQKLQAEHSSLTYPAKVFQYAANNGPAAFSAACEQYGAPVVLNDGASAGGVDILAYGFAAGDSARTPTARTWTWRPSYSSFGAR